MSTFWIVLNVISAVILIVYIAYGIRKKKLIKNAKITAYNKILCSKIKDKEN